MIFATYFKILSSYFQIKKQMTYPHIFKETADSIRQWAHVHIEGKAVADKIDGHQGLVV